MHSKSFSLVVDISDSVLKNLDIVAISSTPNKVVFFSISRTFVRFFLLSIMAFTFVLKIIWRFMFDEGAYSINCFVISRKLKTYILCKTHITTMHNNWYIIICIQLIIIIIFYQISWSDHELSTLTQKHCTIGKVFYSWRRIYGVTKPPETLRGIEMNSSF